MTVTELPIPYQYKLGIIGAIEVGAKKAQRCCLSDQTFMYECFRFIIDGYEKFMAERQAQWDQIERGVRDLYGYPY